MTIQAVLHRLFNDEGVAHPHGPSLRVLVIFGAALLVSNVAGNIFYFSAEQVSTFWPSSGLVLSALLLTRTRDWPTFIAVFIAAQTFEEYFIFGHGIGYVLSLLAPNIIENLLAATTLRLVIGARFDIRSTVHFMWFVAIAVVGATAVGAGIGAFAVTAHVPEATFARVWQVWWFADALGMLIAGPLMLSVLDGAAEAAPLEDTKHAELLIWMLSTATASAIIFSGGLSDALAALAFPWTASLFLVWAALRFDLRVVAGGLMMMACILIAYADMGRGPFIMQGPDPRATVLYLQSYLAVLALTFLTLSLQFDTNRLRMKQLRRQAFMLAQAEASARMGYVRWNVGTNELIECSGALTAVLGLTAEGLNTRLRTRADMLAFIHPEDRSAAEAAFRQLTAGPSASEHAFDVQYRIAVNGQPVRFIRHTSTAQRDVRARGDESFEILQDITAIKLLEHDIMKAQKLEVVGRLTGGIAHDFANILMAARANVEFIEIEMQEKVTPSLRDIATWAGRAARTIDSATSLAKQLLGFARPTTNMLDTVIDVNDGVRTAVGLCESVLRKNIIVTASYDDNVPQIRLDPSKLSGALLNMALNSQDAMPDGGKLMFETRALHVGTPGPGQSLQLKPGVYAAITVTDTGEGIAADNLEKVFEPFFSTKAPGHGTGLGLHMVHYMAQQMGGDVTIVSTPGEGTRISMYLPAHDQPDLHEQERGQSRDPARDKAPAGA